MSLLPRLFALSLFVVLAALVALLGLAAAADRPREGAASSAAAHPADLPPAHTSPASPATARALRLAHLPLRAALPLAIAGAVLSAALLASLAWRPVRTGEAGVPLAAARAEIESLEQLARASLAQGEALAHERDGRVRAEENARLNEHRLNQSVEAKVRLGRDLHDGIIQSLYATGLLVESARRQVARDPAAADQRLGQCVDRINAAIREVRAYISGLTSTQVRHEGLAAALRTLFDELCADRGATLELALDETAAAALSAPQETELLQIAREAFSNSLRHGHARRLTVRLHPGDGALAFLVQDDGNGFDTSLESSGHGRANMQARAGRLGGTLSVQSQPGHGARVVLTLPMEDSA